MSHPLGSGDSSVTWLRLVALQPPLSSFTGRLTQRLIVIRCDADGGDLRRVLSPARDHALDPNLIHALIRVMDLATAAGAYLKGIPPLPAVTATPRPAFAFLNP